MKQGQVAALGLERGVVGRTKAHKIMMPSLLVHTCALSADSVLRSTPGTMAKASALPCMVAACGSAARGAHVGWRREEGEKK